MKHALLRILLLVLEPLAHRQFNFSEKKMPNPLN